MSARIATLVGSTFLITGLSIGTLGAHAGHGVVSGKPGVTLNVDRPLAHLGDTVAVKGSGFTAGASVAIYLHGPFDTGMGTLYARVKVAQDGTFVERVALKRYPDKAARDGHQVIVTALPPVGQEGTTANIQLDPVLTTSIAANGPLRWSSLVLNGIEVHTAIATLPGHHFRLTYPGYLRAGVYSAYLKWQDATGTSGGRAWTFRVGSPYQAFPDHTLRLSTGRVKAGHTFTVTGQYWTAGATISIRAGHLNAPPDGPVLGRAVVDAQGDFSVVIKAPAAAAGSEMIAVSASGSAVGDLPEGSAAPLIISR